jgi:hypothetical protein
MDRVLYQEKAQVRDNKKCDYQNANASASLCPVHETQPADADKLAFIVRDEAQASGARMTRNHDIEGSNRISSRSKLGADVPGMFSRAEVEVQDIDAPKQTLDDVKIPANGL